MMTGNRRYKLLLTAIRDRHDALRKAESSLNEKQEYLKTCDGTSGASRRRREMTVTGIEILVAVIRDIKQDIYDLECWKQDIILGREVS